MPVIVYYTEPGSREERGLREFWNFGIWKFWNCAYSRSLNIGFTIPLAEISIKEENLIFKTNSKISKFQNSKILFHTLSHSPTNSLTLK